jgi:hypothetical protein
MNYLVVGKNGSGKSYFCVKITKEFVDQNKVNLSGNSVSYSKNYEFLRDRDYEQLFVDFSQTLELLKPDNPKVYAPYETPEQLQVDFALFIHFEDEIDFNDYFRMHIIYNDFLKFVSKIHEFKFEFLKPVHKIYSDINGIKIETVEPSPEDWRTAPLGSKIFYDEFQDRPEYLFDGNKPSKNPMILELSKIRHYDIDLYLITPDSENLHKSLRKIVHVMYFVKRPHGNPQCSSLYTFDQFLANPRAAADSKREPKKYSAYELITYKKSIQRLYTSAANHSSMAFQIPWKWIRNAFLIIVGIVLVLTMFFKIPIFGFFADAVKGMFGQDNALTQLKGQTASQGNTQNKTPSSSAQQSSSAVDLSQECRKAVNVEKSECIKWFDDLSKSGSSVSSTGEVTQTVSYNPNKPYDFDYKPQVQPTDFPRMSGVIRLRNGNLMAVDQQGNYMQNISQNDCKRWLDGYRPFNYFAQSQNQQRERSAPEQPQSIHETSSL